MSEIACTPEQRDRMTEYFQPENHCARNFLKRDRLDAIAKILLGTDEIIKDTTWNRDESEEVSRIDILLKEDFYNCLYFQYSRVFELCRVLGIANLYDIGCQTINQSFLLMNYTTASYTGIMNTRFYLNDFRMKDFDDNNCNDYASDEAPPPFCGGRIRFIKGHYPDFTLDVKPNNIAIACYSITMCRNEESIAEMVSALTRDFDRVLFNVPYTVNELVELWKKQDWTGYEIYPVGPQGYVFCTKIPEDIRRMKETYPFDGSRFVTGIDDSSQHMNDMRMRPVPDRDPYRDYTDWNL